MTINRHANYHDGMVATSRRVRALRRRKRRMDAADNDLTPAEWTAIATAWGGCAYCGSNGVPLQRDCVQPLSRGGRYTATNIVPACGPCNASKSNDEVTSWLRRKRLDERAFLLRYAEITSLGRFDTPTSAGDSTSRRR